MPGYGALKLGDEPHPLVVQVRQSAADDVLTVERPCFSAQPGGYRMFGENPQSVVHLDGIGRNEGRRRRDGRKRECRRRGSKETEKGSAFHAPERNMPESMKKAVICFRFGVFNAAGALG